MTLNKKLDCCYSIKEMERLSGIKAHTIRIWEKRYNLLCPERTASNIRLYSNVELRKIINVASLVEQGMKISEISELSDTDICSIIEDRATGNDQDVNAKTYIDGLTSAMIGMDEQLFEKIFNSSVLRFGVEGTFTRVIYPYLVRVGTLWATDQIIPANEHFASQLIKRKLFCAIDGLMAPSAMNKKVALFLHEKENHEIGLLMADYILRSSGYCTWNLGASVPMSNLKPTADQLDPEILFTFIVLSHNTEERNEWISTLSALFPNREIWIAIHKNNNSLPEFENVVYLNSIEDLNVKISAN